MGFKRIYTKITNITKATCTLKAEEARYGELATVNGMPAQVISVIGDKVTLQVFSGTEGVSSHSEVLFTGSPPSLKVSDLLAGRFLNGYGEPIDGGPELRGEARMIKGNAVNPVKRSKPSTLLATGIAGIDLNNTLVTGQKIPFFANPDQPYNQVLA
jgi:V/A-type H+-transporting ATPase subunit B